MAPSTVVQITAANKTIFMYFLKFIDSVQLHIFLFVCVTTLTFGFSQSLFYYNISVLKFNFFLFHSQKQRILRK